MPFVRPVLGMIAAVFAIGGVFGIPAVHIVAGQHDAPPLRARVTFMVVRSVICVGLGRCSAVGAGGVKPG